MLRQQGNIPTPPATLRQRRHGRTAEAGSSSSTPAPFNARSIHGHNDTLDVSICHPHAFSNRFSVLATPPPVYVPDPMLHGDDLPPPPPRRQRNSRGTKEAKKRRDLRRNRRKLAAQMLDEQLSQTIDQTLARVNFPLPQQQASRALALPVPSPAAPVPPFLRPQPMHLPLTPPEIPLPEFSAFDLSSFSQYLQTTPSPPFSIPSPFRGLPRWCPPIPSLTMSDVWRDFIPTFYDLSSLPEPKEQERGLMHTIDDGKQPCMQMQLWKPSQAPKRREHSRFFPPRKQLKLEELGFVQPKAKVKLPATACRLHAKDDGIQTLPAEVEAAPLARLRSYESMLLEPYGHTLKDTATQHELQLEKATAVPEHQSSTHEAPDPVDDLLDEATAANLWRILSCQQPVDVSRAAEDTYTASTVPLPHDPDELCHPGPLLFASREHFCQSPFELDGRELPYVHANSFTGHSNDTELILDMPDYEARVWETDSDVLLPIVHREEDMSGLNELVVDHNMQIKGNAVAREQTLLAFSPLSRSLTLTASFLARELPVDALDADTEHTGSDAHFHSEQALFEQSPAITPLGLQPLPDVSTSMISLADFLKLGHARDCWCGFCGDKDDVDTENDTSSTKVSVDETDSPVSINTETASHAETPELISLDDTDAVSEDADDGWLLYSEKSAAAEEGRSVLYLPSSPVLHRPPESSATPIIAGSPDGTAPQAATKDDVFPSRPSSAWESYIAAPTSQDEDDANWQDWEEMWEGDLL